MNVVFTIVGALATVLGLLLTLAGLGGRSWEMVGVALAYGIYPGLGLLGLRALLAKVQR